MRDTALVMDAMVGHERADPASLDLEPSSYTADLDEHAGQDLAGLTVAVPTNFFFDDVDADVDAAVRAAIGQLELLGARVVQIAIPMSAYISAAAQLIVRAEAAAYHRRMMRASGDLYTEQVRRGILAGEVVLATDYIDALRIRTLVQREWSAMVIGAGIDVIAAPTCPIPAPPSQLGSRTWASGLVEDLGRAVGRYSAPANLLGLPGSRCRSG